MKGVEKGSLVERGLFSNRREVEERGHSDKT